MLSTPDSFTKLVHACQDLEFNLYKECFLLLDEYHSVITELGYRENMIKPLDFLFDFENKSLISATPFNLSDPRFDPFTRIKINTEHLNKDVNVVFSKDIYGVLISLIEQARSIPNSNVHLFYNSVRSIVKVVSTLKEKEDINIFCANTKENIGKLGNLRGLLAQLGQQEFKKLNFYTTKYNEGWDLHDENAFIVLISDVNLQQTCFDIEIKGTQAIGRLRNKAREVYHITNHGNTASVNTNNISREIKKNAQDTVLAYNYINKNFDFTSSGAEIIDSLKAHVGKFSDIDITDNTAKLNYNKVDSGLYEALSKNKYSNQQIIISSWKNAGFEVNAIESTLQVSVEDRRILRNSRIGQSKKNEQIVNKIRFYEINGFCSKNNLDNMIIDFSGLSEWQGLIQENPRLYKFYNKLGYRKMKELNFSFSKMEKAYLLQTCNRLEVSKELKDYIHSTFNCGSKYPSILLKEKLSKIYEQFNVPKKVTASAIKRYFVAGELTYRLNGEATKGYILHRKI